MSDPKRKKTYLGNIKARDIKNKNFWKNVKPLYLEKKTLQTNIWLVEKCKVLTEAKISSKADKMIPDNKKVAETFHDFFVKIGPILKCFPKHN